MRQTHNNYNTFLLISRTKAKLVEDVKIALILSLGYDARLF